MEIILVILTISVIVLIFILCIKSEELTEANGYKEAFWALEQYSSLFDNKLINGKRRDIQSYMGPTSVVTQVEQIKADIALEKKVSSIATDIANEAIDRNEMVKKQTQELTDLYNRTISGLNFDSLHIDDYVPSKKKTTKKATTKKTS